jgi:hypothetical protein
MTDDDHDVSDISSLKISDAAFDYRLITEGKQRLEDAHAARASGGEQNCGDVIQLEVS